MTRNRIFGALAALALGLVALAPHSTGPSSTADSGKVVAQGCEWCSPGR